MTFDEFCIMFSITVKLTQKANDDYWYSELLKVFYIDTDEDDLVQVRGRSTTIRKSLRELCKILSKERCVKIRDKFINLPEIRL